MSKEPQTSVSDQVGKRTASGGCSEGGRKFGAAQRVCFTGTLTSNGRLMYYDLHAKSSMWLFKSPLSRAGAYVGGGGIYWRPR